MSNLVTILVQIWAHGGLHKVVKKINKDECHFDIHMAVQCFKEQFFNSQLMYILGPGILDNLGFTDFEIASVEEVTNLD